MYFSKQLEAQFLYGRPYNGMKTSQTYIEVHYITHI